MLSVFSGNFFWKLSFFILRLFQSSLCLRFFSEGFSERTLEWESGDFGKVFWAQKCPFLRPENGKNKVLPFLGFFRSSIFVTARFYGRFWAVNSESCIGCVSAGSGCAFLYGFTYLIQGVLVFFAVLGTLGPRFRGSFSLSSSFFFPLSFLGPAWGLFLSLLCACCQDHLASSRQVRLSTCFFACCLFFLFSLPGSAPLSLALSLSFLLSLSFFLSFFLSFSLSLLHAVQNCRAGMNLALR